MILLAGLNAMLALTFVALALPREPRSQLFSQSEGGAQCTKTIDEALDRTLREMRNEDLSRTYTNALRKFEPP